MLGGPAYGECELPWAHRVADPQYNTVVLCDQNLAPQYTNYA